MKADNHAGAVAARWLKVSPEERERTGVMAPSHELRQAFNGHIRERLARGAPYHGPAMQAERLVSRGYTNAEKALAGIHRRTQKGGVRIGTGARRGNICLVVPIRAFRGRAVRRAYFARPAMTMTRDRACAANLHDRR